jgi:hypothetical protein
MAYGLFAIALCMGFIALAFHSLVSGRKSPVISRIHSLISDVTKTAASSSSNATSHQKTADADYSQILPPSQREFLAQVSPQAAAASPKHASGELLRFEEDYRQADPAKRVFSGFTIGEIKALGDFPDYATLSDVPLPSPLVDFDVTKAVPRPYRPFRWSYHQTMCKAFLPPCSEDFKTDAIDISLQET